MCSEQILNVFRMFKVCNVFLSFFDFLKSKSDEQNMNKHNPFTINFKIVPHTPNSSTRI